MSKLIKKYQGGGEAQSDGILSSLTNKFAKSFEGLDFESKLRKANELLPIAKAMGLENQVKAMARKIMMSSAGYGRKEEDIKEAVEDESSTGYNYTGSRTYRPGFSRNLIDLALYGKETGFKRVPEAVKKSMIVPLNKELDEKYANVPTYYMDTTMSPKDSIPYEKMLETVGSLMNRKLARREWVNTPEIPYLKGEQLLHKADSVLRSITPTNRVIYSTNQDKTDSDFYPVTAPYEIKDNVAGYSAMIDRDPKTGALYFKTNDVWDFGNEQDKNSYADRWAVDSYGDKSYDYETTKLQADLASKITKPFRLATSNPVAKPTRKYGNGGNIVAKNLIKKK